MTRTLYRLARIGRDVRAVAKGKIGKRLVNKWIGRKIVSRLWVR